MTARLSSTPALACAIAMTLAVSACQRSETTPATNPAPAPVADAAPTQAPAAAPVPGPVEGTRITEAYARMVARQAYFWAWPMINVYNRRLTFKDLPEPGLMGGVVPVAPLNRLSMLSDYIEPQERMVACPNQDVVYGAASIGLDVEPVVIQVPDFGDRFWVYQVVDLRTDSFAELGKMYGTKPGFYLLAGPDWKGEVPKGIAGVFRSSTNTGFVIPRVFQDANAEDKQAVQPLINQIDMYPLSMFDGKLKQRDWSKQTRFPAQDSGGGAETAWVVPEKFVDELPLVLKDARPLAGEEARYAEVLAVIAAAQKDPKLKAAMIDEARKAEQDLVSPLLQFRNYGLPLAHNWTTQSNGAKFGTDYFTRTAVAKSNIFVNKPNETKYFYQDLDESGTRLNGGKRYTVTFAKDQLPPVKGFWSLTLYNQHHFFAPNEIKRYSVGTKNKDLQLGADGSLTIYVQSDAPADPAQRANWLPAPKGEDFSLYIRTYWPQDAITSGQWTPPAVTVGR
ncbi:MAG TPA: DUF1254 domain-containing protein [Lysobacter sp.]